MAHAGKLVCALILCGIVLVLNTQTADGQTYSGHTVTVLRSYTRVYYYCALWYRWWGCSLWRWRWVTVYYYQKMCAPGWTHNGNYDCNIPICRPNCLNQGNCTNPNVCTCPSTSTGPICGSNRIRRNSVTCSYERPCYPGDCVGGTTCSCDEMFSYVNSSEGCTKFNDPSLEPIISKSLVTLSNVRRVDNLVNFMFILDGTNKTITDVIWINQRTFNNITFEMESTFNQPEGLPDRPNYVHDAKMGITLSRIYIRISSIARGAGNFIEDSQPRDLALNSTYSCNNGESRDNPAVEKATCTVIDDQFKTAIEHGDWMTLTFQTFSGGYQKLVNIDYQSRPYATRYYRGYEDVTQVRFKFDFRAPTHCSEPNAYNRTCPLGATILDIGIPFTKNAITPRWLGWVDDLSGIWEYYVEVFRLGPNFNGKLTELTPINPEYTALISHNDRAINYTSYTPTEPGMYSVLMETRDVANNSRTSRRLVLYDPISKIDINKSNESKLYAASAVAETGYTWQTGSSDGTNVQFRLRWSGHFVNKIHEEGKLLNAILPYPIQFKDIQDDGVLYSEKFVNASLDAPTEYIEGQRTRAAITNFHGIVKFETGKVLEEKDTEPDQWDPVQPLAEERIISMSLRDGDKVRLWVRATDIMGNKVTDKAIVGIDRTAPAMSDSTFTKAQHSFTKDVKDSSFVFSSNVKVATSDDESGVYRIDFKIWMTINGREFLHSRWSEDANSAPIPNPNCKGTFGNRCFIPQQSIDIDNCRFIVNKTDLDNASARLEVAGVNQALLSTSTNFSVGPVNKLGGLEKYSGPTNIRTENPTANGFRVRWDLPEHPSCYGIADIVIIIIKTDATGRDVQEVYSTSGTATYFDILGLEPETTYSLKFSVKGIGDSETDFKAQTGSPPSGGIGTGAIVGVVVGLLLACCLAVAVLFVLMRKGIIHPQERAREIRRAVTVKARSMRRRTNQHVFANAGYEARQSDLYTYGIETVEGCTQWQLDRNDVTLESLLKAGHFANIYTARMRSYKYKVVAKLLKENFTAEDTTVMRAKMNFAGKKVGDHPNILKFLGGVVTDTTLGPFILYEYCEKGTLRDYLVSNQGKVTVDVQENLFRFCLEICKGMSYLASKQIVHRRLAARNILLTLTNEVRIYGFGPQPNEEDGADAETAKKERIPIKWMAPECMISTKDASEKSDVWSFGIVVWEIFSLGQNPFENIRSKDLPSRVKKGERPAKPEQADDTWYGIMTRCWTYEQRKRPKFADICPEIEGLFVAPSGDDNYYYQR